VRILSLLLSALPIVLVGACGSFGTSTPAATEDAGDAATRAADGGLDADGQDAQPPTRLVWVSRKGVKPGASFLANAQQICYEEGKAARGDLARFVPWLSITTADAIDALVPGRSWALANGDAVLDSPIVALTPLRHAIDRDAAGAPRGAKTAWTGTAGNGRKKIAAENCLDFSSGSAALHAIIGSATDRTDERWTDDRLAECDTEQAIICFEL
jgi:hypothetical protein